MTLTVPDHPYVAVLDFGGQYAHLIANRIRRLGVYSEIFPSDVPPEDLKAALGVILSGGPSSVYDRQQPPFHAGLFELEQPMLGLCYGHQLLARQLGGEVARGQVHEYGAADLQVVEPVDILEGLAERERVWMSHGDQVTSLPEGFRILAGTPDCPVAAMGDRARRRYGLQFHPEVTHTEHGRKVLENFLDLCGAERTWTPGKYVPDLLDQLRRRAGDDRVLLLVSGGVDSTVCFALLNRALGPERVAGLHIDNGLMRRAESELVRDTFARQGYTNLTVVDASGRFLDALKGVIEPEEKRRIIGRVFVETAQAHLGGFHLEQGWQLAQGTIYPDTIETGGSRHAATIKTHHNRVEEIERLIAQGRVIEPLAHLYKDEVREVGLELGLPEELIWRHPFPGPGLGVRLLCHHGQLPEPAEQAALADYQRQADLLAADWGYGATVLPIRSVGVQGDFRTYAHPLALQGGARHWGRLEEASTGITNAIKGLNRVVYTLGYGTLENLRPVAGLVTAERLELLRTADHLAMEMLRAAELDRTIWQMPAVLLPLGVGERVGGCLVLRPVLSQEAMTARFADLPWDLVEMMGRRLGELPGVGAVFYDITHKPPGTIEWE